MGSHRAEGRAPSRLEETSSQAHYVGRRIARPTQAPEAPAPTIREAQPQVAETAETIAEAPTTAAAAVVAEPASSSGAPLAGASRAGASGKRKAVKHAGSRGPLFRGLPSPPILVGLTVLAVAVGGALTAGNQPTGPALAHTVVNDVRPATALSGNGAMGAVGSRDTLSRSADRGGSGSDQGDLQAATEAQAAQRDNALGALAQEAQREAEKIEENRWFLPLNPSITTAEFGDYGLWASYHTGLDFNGENGDPIHAIANGVVTFAGSDGSYGNKTVVTLEDGTEIWYCHQTDFLVSVGDQVIGNQIIGTVGSTGNVTGSHLHVEVRPGGGDPVDPYAAMVEHGVTP
ncbi:M23 family metallopeptidase [Nocardioides sp. GXZ039]|uniref:M23 family metallopeptidase n=1 Tax=Nocardioides sp. GXZ039 TaxID=3136018 RepID=UPI0030F3B3AD